MGTLGRETNLTTSSMISNCPRSGSKVHSPWEADQLSSPRGKGTDRPRGVSPELKCGPGSTWAEQVLLTILPPPTSSLYAILTHTGELFFWGGLPFIIIIYIVLYYYHHLYFYNNCPCFYNNDLFWLQNNTHIFILEKSESIHTHATQKWKPAIILPWGNKLV